MMRNEILIDLTREQWEYILKYLRDYRSDRTRHRYYLLSQSKYSKIDQKIIDIDATIKLIEEGIKKNTQ
jgi:hypothetical protein